MDFVMKNPFETPYWMTRLLWMMENQPRHVQALFMNRKLAKTLDEAVLRALAYRMRLAKRGLPEDALEEMVLAVLAPTDGPALNDPEPPEPLTERLRAQLLEWARNQKPRTARIDIPPP